MTNRALDEHALQMSHVFDAPREAVFRAWTDPDELRHWFGMGLYDTLAEVDFRVGGTYRYAMKSPEGDGPRVTGSYREIEAPSRLVYTWRWEGGGPDERESLVTVEFHDLGGRTEVQLSHSGFFTDDASARHGRGWGRAIEELRAFLTAQHHT